MATEKQNNMVARIKAARPEVTFEQVEEGSKVLMTAEGFPTISIGKQGGVDLLEIKSFPQGKDNPDGAFVAAVKGDELLKKQQARAEKKLAAAIAVAAPISEDVNAPQVTEESLAQVQG